MALVDELQRRGAPAGLARRRQLLDDLSASLAVTGDRAALVEQLLARGPLTDAVSPLAALAWRVRPARMAVLEAQEAALQGGRVQRQRHDAAQLHRAQLLVARAEREATAEHEADVREAWSAAVTSAYPAAAELRQAVGLVDAGGRSSGVAVEACLRRRLLPVLAQNMDAAAGGPTGSRTQVPHPRDVAPELLQQALAQLHAAVLDEQAQRAIGA